MNIDKYYLVSIGRTASRRKENIKKLKQSVKEYTGKNIYTFGVDGKKLNRHIVKGLKRNNIFKNEKKYRYDKSYKRTLKMSEIGCFLSHIEIWKDIVKNNIKYALVLEDDALFTTNNFFKKIEEIIYLIPENADFISLFHHTKLLSKYIIKMKEYNENLLKTTEHLTGTVGYILTFKGAKNFLKNLLPIKMPVDDAIMKYCLTKETAYLSKIPLVTLCDNFSVIWNRT